MPAEVGRRLVSTSCCEHDRIVVRLADDLQTERQTAGVETARDGRCRQSEIVGEDGVGGRQGLRVGPRLLNAQHRRGRGRQEQKINIAKDPVRDRSSILFDRVLVETRYLQRYGGGHDLGLISGETT